MFARWNPDPVGSESANLSKLSPQMQAIIARARADNPNLRFVLGSGVRSAEDQDWAKSVGWSQTGSKDKDAHTHMAGNAADLWALDEQGRVTFNPEANKAIDVALEAAAKTLGTPINWGGNWKNFKDAPHFELANPGAAPPEGTTTLNSSPATSSSVLDQMRENIGKYESGNNYNILGKRTNKGDQAVGRYQVMKSNIPSWTKKWLGREMTPEEFRADPKAQDAVFNGEFGSYLTQYSPADASSKWFTGGPLSTGANKRDILGTSGTKYVDSTIGGISNPYAFNGASVMASAAPTTVAPTAPVAAAPAAPTFSEAAAKGDVGGMFKSLITKPPPKTDDKGNQVEQKSTLENVADAFGSKGGGQQQGPAPIPEMAPAPVAVDPMIGMAPAAQQLFQQVSQVTAKPLSWTSDPYGANAGLQRIRQGGGTTLNNTGYGYDG